MPPRRVVGPRPAAAHAPGRARPAEPAAVFAEPRGLPKHCGPEALDPRREWIVFAVLILLYLLAFSCRLYSVVRFESIIHEFDPQFYFRSTKQLVDHGLTDFNDWFDTEVWYPLGRWVGHTLYPGLVYSASALHAWLHFLSFHPSVRDVCVFLAPAFSGSTAVATFLLTREAFDSGAALFAAALVSMVPGYTSRSVAGSFDNEGIAIFALVFSFYCFVKAVKTGSMFWGAVAALAYGYMVAAWGGYLYIANLIPAYVFGMVLLGRYSARLYTAYCVWHVVGSLLALQIPFVSNNVFASSHAFGHLVFVLMQVHAACDTLRDHLGAKRLLRLVQTGLGLTALSVAVVFVVANVEATLGGSGTDGRFSFLLDPSSSKLPIIASVSEHQASSWGGYYRDLGILLFLAPLGAYYAIAEWSDASIFVLAYFATASYFSAVMIRLLLVLSPVVCMLSGIALSRTFHDYIPRTSLFAAKPTPAKKTRPAQQQGSAPPNPAAYPPPVGGMPSPPLLPAALQAAPQEALNGQLTKPARVGGIMADLVVVACLFACCFHVTHSRWITAELYSSPAVVLRLSSPNGTQVLYDDYREAYSWLRYNTPTDAKVMSWWDYGYQTASMANRTTLVDNNTWNNSHIATVGKCMASSEEECFRIMRRLDVDYVLVVFGGILGYSSDDIGKLPWMIKIASSVYPEVQETDYLNGNGQYRQDASAPTRLVDSMMYKMCYFRFDEMATQAAGSNSSATELGYDRVRRVVVGGKNISLTRIEEAFTSEHWMVRLYRVLKEPPRG
ncbi:Dolichyl-diphosphooligosaccharide--protein glycosyltransferase subunit STT3 [Diplonema papillatum]|nr:Dolichyl-diphosphooligosaccharide--protein glycosyltransferase subunit STT3 [Diplonema papillatum]